MLIRKVARVLCPEQRTQGTSLYPQAYTVECRSAYNLREITGWYAYLGETTDVLIGDRVALLVPQLSGDRAPRT